MRPPRLENRHFRIEIDPINGSLCRIAHPADPHAMNWISCAKENPWHLRSQQWGLGFANLGMSVLRYGNWETPASLRTSKSGCDVTYSVAGMRVRVQRKLRSDRFTELYTFRNDSDRELTLSGRSVDSFAIRTPFNDNHVGAAECVIRRCNTHLWPGDHSAYVCCLRMGGAGPHLGLVLTEGQIAGYSIEGRNRWIASNSRGVFLLNPASTTLRPGESCAIGWVMFWHEGWEDFFRKALAVPGFVRMSANRYTVVQGERVIVKVENASPLNRAKVSVNGKPAPFKRQGQTLTFACPAKKPGAVHCEVQAGRRRTHLDAFVVPPIMSLIGKRAEFIVERQQVNNPRDPLDGAYLVYDNETGALVRDDWYDHNEGRERVAMGVFLALYLQHRRNAGIMASLRRYYRFVCNKLQDSRYRVLEGVGKKPSRLYNFPWVAQFHLEMYRLTGQQDCLRRFLGTFRAYYKGGGHTFYAEGMPIVDGITSLAQAGFDKERRELQTNFERHAREIMARGTNYPKHEVVYEQAIVAAANVLLIETFLVTKKPEYLAAVPLHMRCLESFNGLQPDHRLHEIGIRHWDGFWFGKRKTWGDTMPQYWSTLTAVAFHRYWQATGDASYRERARQIFMNNLCQFEPDGRAHCAYLYPVSVNGATAAFFDPFANDQDWALVHWLQVERDPSAWK